MSGSFSIGRVAGIRIGIHYTWLLAFALIAWSLTAGYFPTVLPDAGPLIYGMTGIAGTLLLFASVLLHELSHSLVARQRGLQVDSITLFVFGGVSGLSNEPTRPRDEFLVAVVGPLTSLVVAGVCWLVGFVLVEGVGIGGALLGYVGFANAVLGVFNLVPGFPLDGGRVLRAILWAMTGSLRQATRIASHIGQGIGYLLVLLGVLLLLDGDVVSGLWLAFIGWFLSEAAQAMRQEHALREALSGIPVSTVMDTQPPIVGPKTSVEELVFDHAVQRGERAVLVVDRGHLLGLVTLADVKKVQRDTWSVTQLEEIMSRAPLQTVTPDTDLTAVLESMMRHSIHQLPVVAGERVVGMVSRAEILGMLRVRDELDLHLHVVKPANDGHGRVATRGSEISST
jgi:Zn-dependent protease